MILLGSCQGSRIHYALLREQCRCHDVNFTLRLFSVSGNKCHLMTEMLGRPSVPHLAGSRQRGVHRIAPIAAARHYKLSCSRLRGTISTQATGATPAATTGGVQQTAQVANPEGGAPFPATVQVCQSHNQVGLWQSSTVKHHFSLPSCAGLHQQLVLEPCHYHACLLCRFPQVLSCIR